MIIVSACLAGYPCRYDGKDNRIEPIAQLVASGKAIAVCPEELGGLSTPRKPAEIVGGTAEAVWIGSAAVRTNDGEDVGDAFMRGAQLTLEKALAHQATVAILKERSPSCGSQAVYDGTFSKQKIPGCGVTTALLQKYGITVFSEETIGDALGTIGS